jgi:hypothetical protein
MLLRLFCRARAYESCAASRLAPRPTRRKHCTHAVCLTKAMWPSLLLMLRSSPFCTVAKMQLLRLAALLLLGAVVGEPVFEDSPTLTSLWQATSDGSTDAFINQLIQNRESAKERAADGRGAMFWAYEFKNVDTLALLMHLGIPTGPCLACRSHRLMPPFGATALQSHTPSPHLITARASLRVCSPGAARKCRRRPCNPSPATLRRPGGR